MKAEYINLDIQAAIAVLDHAIKIRNQCKSGSRQKQKRAEFRVHLESRSLFSRFLDVSGWRGSLVQIEVTAVRQALTHAKDSVTIDEQCRLSVSDRLIDFEKFVPEFQLSRLSTAAA